MNINKKLLPVKGHFFLFNAGTAPLVPYLSTYAKQLGFSSSTVGLIYTILPIFGLIAKPLFGVIADRFKVQKPLFIFFQIVTIISFLAIYFIPQTSSGISVALDCNDDISTLRSCYASNKTVDACKVASLINDEGTTMCHINCDMNSPKMWQTVCEHWQLPQYCYSKTKSMEYRTSINYGTTTDDKTCLYLTMNNVTMDGFVFTPRCTTGHGFVDVNESCSLNCSNPVYGATIGDNRVNMTCVDKSTNTMSYLYCSKESDISALTQVSESSECTATCDLDVSSPCRLMEICESWQADVTEICQPTRNLPSDLTFTAIVTPSLTLLEDNCLYMHIDHIEMPDGTTHHPVCLGKTQYQIGQEFHAFCDISCNNSVLNEIFEVNSDIRNENNQYTTQFWLFFLCMIISWIGQAVVVTFADAICFNLLGENVSQYGRQRLWGSVGWGIFSLTTGLLIDEFSDGAYKNYAVAFVLMVVFMSGDVIDSCFIKNVNTRMSMNILADISTMLSSLPTVIFMLWTIGVGLCTGLLWQFLFWHLEDIAALTCDGTDYTKTLQGLVSAIQTFCGEIPFMFISGYVLRKVGHTNMMSFVLFAFGIRFMLYSLLTNAWWVLPIEMFQGITFGMFYPTMTSYASVVSPAGTETTVQGLVGAIFEGVGVSLGSFIGGRLYDNHGGWNTFLWFGIGSVILAFAHVLVQYLLRKKKGPNRRPEGKVNSDVE